MAEWFVGLVMENLLDRCFAYLKDKFFDGCFEYINDQVSWQKGMEEKLQRLRDIQLPKIKAVVSDYSPVEIKDPELNKWYWELRDAVDEADDLLDDFDYMKHEEKVRKNQRKRRAADPNLKMRLEVAVQKLDKVSAEINCLESVKQKLEQEQKQLLQTRETGSIPPNILLGRNNDMESIKRWICTETYQTQIINNDLYRNISLLSLVGAGGMGKTTLLQHVYEDVKLTKEFDVQMWVCVSHNFDAKTVTKNILESLRKQVSNEDSLASLQSILREKVSSKKFLLVLDDIWEYPNESLTWENVLCSLRDGKLGSKILITTRDGSVASNFPLIKNRKAIPLEGLKENECLELFNTHAFGVENPSERLKSIARDIVKKLSGSPLAAKLIGSSLKSQDETCWIRVSNTNIEDLEVGQNGLFPILKLSYAFLPKFLQNCFAFCCIFPQDHEFDKDELVRMWIALGFIQSSNNRGETLEDIGRSYFNTLIQKSFFDEFHHPYNYEHVYYKMHDLLHDLAQSVSKQECFRVVKDKELSIPETIRHLSIHSDNLEAFKDMGEFKNLRSLFLSYYANYDENFVSVLSKFFEASKSIRLLYIYAYNQKGISEKISCLTHLRYFNLGSKNVQFQRSISQLHHLQFLIYDHYGGNISYVDDLLPKDKNNLCNLRYLSIPYKAYDKIYEIGKLKSLQELKYFNVKSEIGYNIGELEHMNELRQISIRQLENIKNADEACKAKFYDKKSLTDLSLCWATKSWASRENTVNHDLDEKVLDSIQSYNNNLKRLCIYSYMGVRSALWMSNVYLISNLEYIELNNCLEWKTLPPFGQLRFLKSLTLHNMPKVEKIDHNKDCMYPSLEKLHIENLKALEEWFDTTVAAENGSFLPCLVKMHLKNCPKLQELHSYPTKLRDLYLVNIGWRGCHWLPTGITKCLSFEIQNCLNIYIFRLKTVNKELKNNENCEHIMDELVISDPSVLLMERLRSISSLRALKIEKNGTELVSFPSGIEQWFLQLSSSLVELKFNNLQSLQPLPSLRSFSSLNHLELSNIPLLKSLPELPSSLTQLSLSYIPLLKSLPGLPSSLTQLSLRNIPLLKSLPDLSSSLTNLSLKSIPLLESLTGLPSSLTNLSLCHIPLLESLTGLPSSITNLSLINIPLLESLPDLPSSLTYLSLSNIIPLLQSLTGLPSSLSFLSLSDIPLLESLTGLPSSLKHLSLSNIPLLKSLPDLSSSLTNLSLCHIPLLESLSDLPSSLESLRIAKLESLLWLPSSLSTLRTLSLNGIPLLKSLPDLPLSLRFLHLEMLEDLRSVPTLPTLDTLRIIEVPRLLELPDLPSSLKYLKITLHCPPSSLLTISSLTQLILINIPLLKSLPDLPPSLTDLHLEKLEDLRSVPTLPTLDELRIIEVPRLLKLPDLPASLYYLSIENCDPQLMERYPNFDRRWQNLW